MSVTYDKDLSDTCNSYLKKFKKQNNSFSISFDEPKCTLTHQPVESTFTISGNPLFGTSMDSSCGSSRPISPGSSQESGNAPRFSLDYH